MNNNITEEFNPDDLPPGWVLVNGRPIPWWYTRDGIIVKYSILLGLFILVTGVLVGSYIHARMRMKKGMNPMGYHRWMVSKRQPAHQTGPYYSGAGPAPPGMYNMYNMAPPPVYDPNRPPVYEGAPVGTKTDPSQWRNEPTRRPADSSDGAPEYQPPPGPPPGPRPL
ncbi:hypothetical protein HJFPF1_01262 [Paramyrothecium foliicola]|nr:hypothetical protein HJFPF1_01262 [Paramyrothecium foliicola]